MNNVQVDDDNDDLFNRDTKTLKYEKKKTNLNSHFSTS
jgi:hypothetical protein